MNDLKQYMINRRDALLAVSEFNMANEFEIMLEDFSDKLSPASGDAVSRKAILERLNTMFANTPYGAVSANIKEIYNEVQSLPPIPSPAEGMENIELMLLKTWEYGGIKEIYKYKRRIRAYREPLTDIDLLYDPSGGMFPGVEDIATTDNDPEDGKVSIAELIQAREALSPSGEQPGPSKSTMGLMTKEEDGE